WPGFLRFSVLSERVRSRLPMTAGAALRPRRRNPPRTLMNRRSTMNCNHLIVAAFGLVAAAPAMADEIYATEDPFGSPFGMIGFDVGGRSEQRVGVRFIPDADYRLDRISVWFMSNDFSVASRAPVRLTVETDDAS